MITTSQQFGAGRVGIKEFVRIDNEQYTEHWNLVQRIKTTQDYETFKQLSDFGYPQSVNEGSPSTLDNKVLLYTASFTPQEYALMFGVTKKAQFTDQYGVVALGTYKQDIADTFGDLDALAVANIYNNAFSASYTGIDGVALCSTAHPYQSYPTWSNRGTGLALGYTTVITALTQRRKVKTARQRPMRDKAGVRLLVPPDIEFTGLSLINSMERPDTANRDTNNIRSRLTLQVDEDLSSTTAWFLLSSDPKKLGTFYLEQMPFDVLTSPDWDVRTRTMYVSCYKSFTTGWKRAQGIWGDVGA